MKKSMFALPILLLTLVGTTNAYAGVPCAPAGAPSPQVDTALSMLVAGAVVAYLRSRKNKKTV